MDLFFQASNALALSLKRTSDPFNSGQPESGYCMSSDGPWQGLREHGFCSTADPGTIPPPNEAFPRFRHPVFDSVGRVPSGHCTAL